MTESPLPPKILNRDLSTDPAKRRSIRDGLVTGVVIGSEALRVSQMAFLLAEITVSAEEIGKVDSDTAVEFLHALADLMDPKRPRSARELAFTAREAAFAKLCGAADAKAMAAGHSDGGPEQ